MGHSRLEIASLGMFLTAPFTESSLPAMNIIPQSHRESNIIGLSLMGFTVFILSLVKCMDKTYHMETSRR